MTGAVVADARDSVVVDLADDKLALDHINLGFGRLHAGQSVRQAVVF